VGRESSKKEDKQGERLKRFALIGAAGYVAPKHMQAIKDIGGDLVAAMDPHDSVGILDRYFPDCKYFPTWEAFDWFCSNDGIDYVSICSPNYLHKDHCWFAHRIRANAICEKPLALTVDNLRALAGLLAVHPEHKIYTILQLRLNPVIQELRERYRVQSARNVVVKYFTPRGGWYAHSWKADKTKAGGLATNIGIHLFDALTWIFGRAKTVEVSTKDSYRVCGFMSMERAETVYFDLSIHNCNPATRTIRIDDEPPISLSNGFTDLHTESYRQIMEGQGFGIEQAYPSLEICEQLR